MSDHRMSDYVGSGGTVRMDCVPIGMLATFDKNIIPFGWLECDGKEFDKDLYPSLYSILGVSVTPLKKNISRIGSINYFSSRIIPEGYLLAQGQEVSRERYKDLFDWTQNNFCLITEAEWQEKASSDKSVPFFSDGDGSATFRIPKLQSYSRLNSDENSALTYASGLIPADTSEENVGVVNFLPAIQSEGKEDTKWWIKAFHNINDAGEIYANNAIQIGLKPSSTVKYGTVKLGSEVRNPVSESVTYYLSNAGSDASDGLTPQTALLTWEGFLSLLRRSDFKGNKVKLSVSGTFSSMEVNSGAFNNGMSSLIIIGEGELGSGAQIDDFIVKDFPNLSIENVKIGSLSSANSTCYLADLQINFILSISSKLYLSEGKSMELTVLPETVGVKLGLSSSMKLFGNLTVKGSGLGVFEVSEMSSLYINGETNYDAVEAEINMKCSQCSLIDISNSTITGTLTGKRYEVLSKGSIISMNKGPTYIPGSLVGTVDTVSGGFFY